MSINSPPPPSLFFFSSLVSSWRQNVHLLRRKHTAFCEEFVSESSWVAPSKHVAGYTFHIFLYQLWAWNFVKPGLLPVCWISPIPLVQIVVVCPPHSFPFLMPSRLITHFGAWAEKSFSHLPLNIFLSPINQCSSYQSSEEEIPETFAGEERMRGHAFFAVARSWIIR